MKLTAMFVIAVYKNIFNFNSNRGQCLPLMPKLLSQGATHLIVINNSITSFLVISHYYNYNTFHKLMFVSGIIVNGFGIFHTVFEFWLHLIILSAKTEDLRECHLLFVIVFVMKKLCFSALRMSVWLSLSWEVTPDIILTPSRGMGHFR